MSSVQAQKRFLKKDQIKILNLITKDGEIPESLEILFKKGGKAYKQLHDLESMRKWILADKIIEKANLESKMQRSIQEREGQIAEKYWPYTKILTFKDYLKALRTKADFVRELGQEKGEKEFASKYPSLFEKINVIADQSYKALTDLTSLAKFIKEGIDQQSQDWDDIAQYIEKIQSLDEDIKALNDMNLTQNPHSLDEKFKNEHLDKIKFIATQIIERKQVDIARIRASEKKYRACVEKAKKNQEFVDSLAFLGFRM